MDLESCDMIKNRKRQMVYIGSVRGALAYNMLEVFGYRIEDLE